MSDEVSSLLGIRRSMWPAEKGKCGFAQYQITLSGSPWEGDGPDESVPPLRDFFTAPQGAALASPGCKARGTRVTKEATK